MIKSNKIYGKKISKCTSCPRITWRP